MESAGSAENLGTMKPSQPAGAQRPVVVSKSTTDKDLRTFSVVKRDGMLVPFRRDRIASAVEAAFRAVKGISITQPLPQDIYSIVQQIADAVTEESKSRVAKGASLTVEGIQDLVEMKLMDSGHYDVARDYILYRDEHKALRDNSPRNLRIYRRDGKTLVRFKPLKIASAIEKAFRASLNVDGATPHEIVESVNFITSKVVAKAMQWTKEGKELHIELVQDEIERQMMAEGFYNIAKDFIIYRAMRAAERARAGDAEMDEDERIDAEREARHSVKTPAKGTGAVFDAVDAKGNSVKVTEAEIRARVQFACKGLEKEVDSEEIVSESIKNFYSGIKIDEIDKSNIMAARASMEKDPAYSYVAARLLLDVIYRETFGVTATDSKVGAEHAKYFAKYVKRGVELERLSPELLNFDLEKLGNAMKLDRDLTFQYLAVQTIYDRYLIHNNGQRLETPQIFWMRVSMGLAINEGEKKNEKAIEFYDVLSQNLFCSSTPTLFNSGTRHPQLSSCYLSTINDDLKHIFKVISDDAQLSKWAGGLGNDWTNVRALGARIKGTNGKSGGVIPFLKVANSMAAAVDQGGKRLGALCCYLETWHLDLEDFIELRKNTGDDRRRTHDMNTANWIPDLFMKRVIENGSWTMFSPNDVPDLHDLYGAAFEARYMEYEKMAEQGKIKLFKKVEAVSIWRKMLSMLFETGHPWMTFKDPSNIRSPQDHAGVVHSSNLCTEILLNTSAEEVAVCNLGSINIVSHMDKAGNIDKEKLGKTVSVAIRMLDNVIDINFYPTAEARNANLRHRPVGLGLMGFQDALYIRNVSYASPEAVAFADESMELISYYALLASSELAKERGAYSSYKGSKWDRGMLPIDTISLLERERGASFLDMDKTAKLNWDKVRESIKKHGMRNSNTMAIAPTATISNITGVTQSIEPTYKHLFAKSNLSGDFIIHNTYLVDELKKRGLWDAEMVDDLKYFDGSILEIERIPDEVKKVYPTAFEIEPEWLIEAGSRRQKWIDMGQSLNLYMAQPSGKKLHDMYIHAWRKGLKTTYYLRSLGATQIEKSTSDINRRGLQPRWMKNKSASSDVALQRPNEEAPKKDAASSAPMPKVCGLDPSCESCQ